MIERNEVDGMSGTLRGMPAMCLLLAFCFAGIVSPAQVTASDGAGSVGGSSANHANLRGPSFVPDAKF